MTDPFDLAEASMAKEAALPDYLRDLNDAQAAAAMATEGPVLVLAGAGTGKTRVLTSRLAHILLSHRASPWEVLAVTFTNKAAREMQARVALALNQPVEGWWIGTFHSIGARILRSHAETAGLQQGFAILGEDDQLRLIKRVLAGRGVDERRCPPRALLDVIQRWKDRGLEPSAIAGAGDVDFADGLAAELYALYQEALRLANAADFGDLLLLCLTMFRGHADILRRYQDKFRYVLVDEYQDANVAQYLWLRLLAQGRKNICCVGDDDQSIYSWRGAEVGNILRFERDFPGAQVIRLERNYRSTPHILAAASGLISNNAGRLGKTLWTGLDQGEKVRVRGVWDGESEARAVCDEIKSSCAKGDSLNGMAVLMRTSAQTREFEECLIAEGIPYRVVGGLRFYERREIRDAIAYLRVIASGADDLAFERIVNFPKRGLGKAALDAIYALARAAGLPLTGAAARLAETDELTPKQRNALSALLGGIDRWRRLMDGLRPAELMDVVLRESGIIANWESGKDIDAPGRLENLKELMVAMEDFRDMASFLEHVSLVMEMEGPAADGKVTLMTMHSAKGLEYDTVFLAGWEEGLFPHQRVMGETGRGGLEEERRLAYVGLTRAKRRAVILHAANRLIHGRWQSSLPSRFIKELPVQHVELTAESGLYGSFPRQRPMRGLSNGAKPFSGENASPSGPFQAGQRVFHQKFGYGRIVAIDGDKLDIAFEKAGGKKVMDSFVEQA